EYNFSREDQDAYAIQSYKRSAAAWDAGKFDNEIVPVEVPQRRGEPVIVSKDEEYTNVFLDKIPSLRPAFSKEGTVTAANASTINDGAGAVVLMSKQKADELGLKPLATIKGYADAAQEPTWFTTAPAKALPKALDRAGVALKDVDYFEFNEAFSVVGLANIKILGLDDSNVNVNGGAVSLGHPLGCSGVRIIITLINVLEQNNAKLAAAAISNGGGGASAIVIERKQMKYGLCNLSLVPVRREASDISEMVSQLLYGEFFKIIESRKQWSKIRNAFDNYEGWIDNKQFLEISSEL